MWRCRSVLYALLLPTAFSCGNVKKKNKAASEVQEFYQSASIQRSNSAFKLAKAQRANIPHETVIVRQSFKAPWGGENVVQEDYEITFRGITSEQCEQLKKLYAINGEGDYQFTSSVKCGQGGNYKLEQFLPPIIQATKNRAFRPEEQGQNTIAANCWGTLYEFARLDPAGMNVFFSLDNEFLPAFKKQRFKKRNPINLNRNPTWANLAAESKYWRTGDLMLINTGTNTPVGEMVMHAFVYIDENLVYQKMAGPETFTYQVNTMDSALKAYGAGKILKAFRPTAKFADPKQTMSLPCKMTTMGVKLCEKISYVQFTGDANSGYSVPMNEAVMK